MPIWKSFKGLQIHIRSGTQFVLQLACPNTKIHTIKYGLMQISKTTMLLHKWSIKQTRNFYQQPSSSCILSTKKKMEHLGNLIPKLAIFLSNGKHQQLTRMLQAPCVLRGLMSIPIFAINFLYKFDSTKLHFLVSSIHVLYFILFF